jgi:Peptidase family M48
MAVPTSDAVEKETVFQENLVRGGSAALPRPAAGSSPISNDFEIRTYVIGNRVLIGGAPLCGKKVVNTMPFGTRAEGDTLQVLWSIDLERETKGLSPGDIIKALDGVPVDAGRRGTRAAMSTLAEVAKANRALKVDIERDGKPLSITVNPTTACDYPIEYSTKDEFNAYADGTKIVIQRGAVRRLDDDELAGVVAHELAHNAMGHVTSGQGNALLGSILGATIAVLAGDDDESVADMAQMGGNLGGLAYSSDFEAEADYVGTYVMARAGFDYEAMPDVMRKMARPDSLKSEWMETHPATPKRAAAAEATIDEIKRKISQGLPLMPELKASAAKAKRPAKKP